MAEAVKADQVAAYVAGLAAAAELSPEAQALLRPQQHPRAYVDALLEAEQAADAIRFLAHALPKREGVWWAWVCARRSAGEEPPPEQRLALDATERWLKQPAEENRRPLLEIAEQADVGSPAGCAALAAFFSGGSIAPPTAPEVAPPPLASARAIAGSVILAGVIKEPEKAPEKYQSFLAQGLGVVDRLKLWPPA
jgi:hypothetical protein